MTFQQLTYVVRCMRPVGEGAKRPFTVGFSPSASNVFSVSSIVPKSLPGEAI